MCPVFKIRVGKRRTVVIPKPVAERLGVDEGSILLVEVGDNYIVLRPYMDAIDLALKGEKVAKATLKDVEGASVEEQEKLGD